MIPDVSDRSICALISLKGRSAAVTGGASGIGFAIARRLAEAGASVAIGDLDVRGAEKAAEALGKEHGTRGLAKALDVRDSRSVVDFADVVVRAFGGLHIWVNNAGVYPVKPIVDLTEEEWDEVHAINLRGTFLGAREAARRMVAMGDAEGRVILNIGSVSGFKGRNGMTHYAASKQGVAGFTRSLALELGTSNIRVLSIAPTLVLTYGLAQRRSAQGSEAVDSLEATVAAGLALGRAAKPDDVARVALFCVSDMALFMTGSTVFADAGSMAT
jgi:NAD(P)-dependent dehydrogenase (short-subunit alcohol dehydrogenase family)